MRLHPKTVDFFSLFFPKTADFFQILERQRKKERKQRKNKETKKNMIIYFTNIAPSGLDFL